MRAGPLALALLAAAGACGCGGADGDTDTDSDSDSGDEPDYEAWTAGASGNLVVTFTVDDGDPIASSTEALTLTGRTVIGEALDDPDNMLLEFGVAGAETGAGQRLMFPEPSLVELVVAEG